MMRRRHKKSRRGCLECKRRHIKCDETRPHCINCTTAERECSFPAGSGSDGTSTAGHSPTDPGARFSVSASPPLSTYTTAPTTSAAAGLAYGAGTGEMPQFTLGGLQEVNMIHMELFHHFMTDRLLLSGAFPTMGIDLIKTSAVQYALREPYLMYQILSVGARHLCFLRPENTAFYQSQAVHLQSRAVNLFNSLDLGYLQRSRGNVVAAFLFSSLVGFQSLCDMLSHRDHDFSAALARFLTYLRIHRGIDRVLDGHRHELAESEIASVIQGIRGGRRQQWFGVGQAGPSSSAAGHGQGHGHECDDLRRRILLLPDLNNQALEQVLEAIDLLQYVIDSGDSQHAGTAASRSHILLSWPALVGDSFVELVETGRPEALAVLGYYFLALHYCRDVWIFCGGSGHYLLTLLSTYLGHKWADWIATPCRLLRESLEREEAAAGHISTGVDLAGLEIEAAAGLYLAGAVSTHAHTASTSALAGPHGHGHGHGYGHGHGHHGQPGPSYWKQ
ncbi:hypothetical protein V8F20_002178 [Naviculisporaceae sp. PSN 640]